MAGIDISIIIVSWNTRQLLLDCLATLPAAIGKLNADVWVVDNGSTDGSISAVQANYPQVQLIVNDRNVGFAAANNQAVSASQGRYALLLNSDTLATSGAIEQLVHFADTLSRTGIVGPMLLNPDGSFQGSFADFPSLLGELLSATGLGVRLIHPYYPNYEPHHSQAARPVNYIQGACMLVRRTAVEQVGLMDEHYFMYNEEIDWCLRMEKSGWEVWYTPTARVIHYGGQSTRQMRRVMVQALYRSKVRFFRKHYGPIAAITLQSAFVLVLWFKWLILALVAISRSGARVEPPIRWRDLQSPLQERS